MAIRTRATFEGFADLAGKLRTLNDPKQIGKTLKTGVRLAMRAPQQRARQLIPVGTEIHKTYLGNIRSPGFARASIRVITKVHRSGLMAFALLGVRREAYYAVQYVELGTSKMAPHPWLRPAFAASTDPMIRALGQEINDWIKDVAKRKGGARGAQLAANAAQFEGGFGG